MPSFNAFDRRLLATSLLLSMASMAACVFITAATDEGAIPWLVRLGRTLPLVPFAAGVGSYFALRTSQRKGELLLLGTLGQRPSRIALGGLVGGLLLGAALALVTGFVTAMPLDGFFPELHQGARFAFEGGAFRDLQSQTRYFGDGHFEVAVTELTAREPTAHELRVTAAMLTFAWTVAVSWTACRLACGRHLLGWTWAVPTACSAATVVLLHLIAQWKDWAPLVFVPVGLWIGALSVSARREQRLPGP